MLYDHGQDYPGHPRCADRPDRSISASHACNPRYALTSFQHTFSTAAKVHGPQAANVLASMLQPYVCMRDCIPWHVAALGLHCEASDAGMHCNSLFARVGHSDLGSCHRGGEVVSCCMAAACCSTRLRRELCSRRTSSSSCLEASASGSGPTLGAGACSGVSLACSASGVYSVLATFLTFMRAIPASGLLQFARQLLLLHRLPALGCMLTCLSWKALLWYAGKRQALTWCCLSFSCSS